MIFRNGIIGGRHNAGGRQREFYLPEYWLDPKGKNVLALTVRNAGDPGGLYEASIRPCREFSVRTWRIEIR